MKKICFLLVFALLLPLLGCSKDTSGHDAVIDIGGDNVSFTETEPNKSPSGTNTEGAVATETPVPTAAPTAVPVIPNNVEEAIEQFEETPMGYTPIDRPAVQPNFPITEPRYSLGADGVYRSSFSTGDNEAVIMLVGDLMCQTRQQEAGKTATGYIFTQGFDYVKDIFAEADFVVGNLENTFSETSPYMSEQLWVEKTPHLNAPTTFIEAVRYAGFDMVVLANNHNLDSGVRGIYDTLGHVDEYKLIHTGLFRSAAETRYTIVDIDGIKVAFLSYGTFYNRKEWHLTYEGYTTLLNPYSKETAARDIQNARAAGAEYVITYIHWGIEYTNDPGLTKYMPAKLKFSDREVMIKIPLDFQYEMAQELADAGTDYIIGSHTHSLQPYDIITSSDGREVPCVYSMGNFISHQKRQVSMDTVILRLTLTRNSQGRVVIKDEGYIPCLVFESFEGHTYAPVPVVKPYNNGLSSDSFYPAYQRITAVMGSKLRVIGTP